MQPPGPGSSENRPERVRIKVPDYYKSVSEEVWVDLEQYLFSGFLTSPADVLGKSFVFKSLNHVEVGMLSHLRPANGSAIELQASFRSSFIAHSVFIVDGENALYRRPTHIRKLIRIFSRLPQDVQAKLVETLRILNEKASRLHPLTEVYVHENRSRYKWLQLTDIPVHSPLATGIAGTDELGMNYCQQTWTALNRLLDEKETVEREWTNAKFIGSCFAGKGVRAIDERDRSRRERDRVDREERKMEVLYRYLNRRGPEDADKPATVTLPDGRLASVTKKFQADSVEELADQLSAALSGEKDHHDLVVERKMSQIRKARDRMESERYAMYRGSILKDGAFTSTSVPIHGPSRILGGRAEADAQLSRMKAVRDAFLARQARQVPADLESSDGEPEVGP